MSELYRKSAIERLSNPDQLDRRITISSPASWLVLIGLALIIVIIGIWAFRGSLPVTITVSGVLTNPIDSCALYSDYSGTIALMGIKPGMPIKKGDIIAKVKSSNGEEECVYATEPGTISSILVEDQAHVFVGTELLRYTPMLENNWVVVCYVPIHIVAQLKTDMKVLLYPISIDSNKTGHLEASIMSIGEYAANIENMLYVLGPNNLLSEQFTAQGPVVAVVCRIRSDSSSANALWWSNRGGKNMSLPKQMLVSAKIIVDEYAPISILFSGLR